MLLHIPKTELSVTYVNKATTKHCESQKLPWNLSTEKLLLLDAKTSNFHWQ